MKAATKVWRTWGLVCLAAWIGGGCATQPKVDLAKALIDARITLRAAAEQEGTSAMAVTTRRHAMQAIGEVGAEEDGGLLKQALDDPDEGVRFAAAMSIGDIRYAPALPTLRQKAKMRTGERWPNPYCAVLYALHCLGDDSQLGDLASMLSAPDADVRAVAALVMEKLGNPAAIEPLKRAVKDETKYLPKYNMIEALAVLGDSANQILLQAYVTGYWADLQLEAIPAWGRTYSPDTMQILRNLMSPENLPRVRVRAAGVMARLGQITPEGYNLCVEAARHPEKFAMSKPTADRMAADTELASIQQLAALSLGWMRSDAVATLEPLLRSPDGRVRVAAALSIIRLLSPPRIAPAAAAAPAAEGPSNAVIPPPLRTSGAKD